MLPDLMRLCLGLLIAAFHRPVADYIMQHERQLVILFRQRGVPVPQPPTTETARNIYFMLGISLAMFEVVRIWLMLHPLS